MSPITWLHLSDLHFGSRRGVDQVLNALLRDVQERIEQDKLQPDFIAITGDIANRGLAEEYDQAGEFLQALLRTTGLTTDRLFIVPGNHDVNRSAVTGFLARLPESFHDEDSVTESLKDAQMRNLLFRRLTNYFAFYNKTFNPDPPVGPDHYFTAHRLQIEGWQVAVVGLNSAFLAYGGDDDRQRLLVGESQVLDALAQVQGADLTVALMHHPVDWLLEFDVWPVKSPLWNQCHLVLHGHLHVPDIVLQISLAGSALIIPAGASYEGRNRANSYSLTRVDLDNRQATIYLRRWFEQYNRWVADERVRGGIKQIDLPRDLAAHWQRPAPPIQPPEEVQNFVGREQQIEELVNRLTKPESESTEPGRQLVIVGIVGMTGVGKSSLARHIAHDNRIRQRFPDGVLWADLRVDDPMDVLSKWATKLGLAVHSLGSLDERARIVKSRFAGKRYLCVLDHAEGRLNLTALLPSHPTCAAIVISQDRELDALRGLTRIELEPMTLEEAEQLFRRVLGDKRIDTEPNSKAAIVQIAKLLGCSPLALDLVTAQLATRREWTLHQMAEQLISARYPFGELELEDKFPYVGTSFETTFKSLAADQRARFPRLAIFHSAAFSIEAVAALGDEDESTAKQGIEQLQKLSIVTSAGEGYWSLHPLLLFYANRLLDNAGERDDLSRRHADYFFNYTRRQSQEESWQPLEKVRPDIIQSLKWYQEHEPQAFVNYVLATFRFYYVRGYWDENQDLMLTALAMCQGMKKESSLLMKNLALMYYRRGHLRQAVPWLEKALTGFRELGEKREEASVLIRQGWIQEDESRNKEDYDKARALYKDALNIGWQLPHETKEETRAQREIVARAQHQIANSYLFHGNYQRARELYEISMNTRKELGDLNELSKSWRQLAIVERAEGHLHRARELVEGSLQHERSTGELRKLSICLVQLALIKAEIGIRKRDGTLLGEALHHAQEAKQYAEQLKSLWESANACYAIGYTYLLKREWSQAEEYLESSRKGRLELNDTSRLSSSYQRLGQLAELRGDTESRDNARGNARLKYYCTALEHYVDSCRKRVEIGNEPTEKQARHLAARVASKIRTGWQESIGSAPPTHRRHLRIRMKCDRITCERNYECDECYSSLIQGLLRMDPARVDVYRSGSAGLDDRLHILFDTNVTAEERIKDQIPSQMTRLGYRFGIEVEASGPHEEWHIDDLEQLARNVSSLVGTELADGGEQ